MMQYIQSIFTRRLWDKLIKYQHRLQTSNEVELRGLNFVDGIYLADLCPPTLAVGQYASLQPTARLLEKGEIVAARLPVIANEDEPHTTLSVGQSDEDDLEDQQDTNELEITHKLTTEETQKRNGNETLLDTVLSDRAAVGFEVGFCLDPGIKRRNAPNEDNLFTMQRVCMTAVGPESVGLFVVADGMGGYADGQEASNIAVRVMREVVEQVISRDTVQDIDFLALLKYSVSQANWEIYQCNCQRPPHKAMGTTLTAALIVARTAYIVNVGDSRTYVYRKDGELSLITRDHSLVAEMVEHGMITPDEVYTHPQRNQIYRCLGSQASLEVDGFVEELSLSDALLLCSDGLWEMVRDRQMQEIVKSSVLHPSLACNVLVQAALDCGGVDNISVIVVRIV